MLDFTLAGPLVPEQVELVLISRRILDVLQDATVARPAVAVTLAFDHAVVRAHTDIIQTDTTSAVDKSAVRRARLVRLVRQIDGTLRLLSRAEREIAPAYPTANDLPFQVSLGLSLAGDLHERSVGARRSVRWGGRPRFHARAVGPVMAIDRAASKQQTLGHEELFLELSEHLPKELIFERQLLVCRL
jgi:hypothetical protein